jgi:hypothetical protein
MESLKLIPSVFFDGIARVVPGAVAIVAFLLISERPWSRMLETTLGPPFASGDAVLTATALLFFTAYVVGQLIAPFAKWAQRIGESKFLKPKPTAPRGAYDYLRLHYADAGAQCAKIRAEFTMFNGLAVVFLASAACYWLRTPAPELTIFITLLAASVATAVRGRTTRDTFNETVGKFVDGTAFPKPPAA